jgi:hypothetical protein
VIRQPVRRWYHRRVRLSRGPNSSFVNGYAVRGAGVYVGAGVATLRMANSTVLGNVAENGAGMYLSRLADLVSLTSCDVSGNIARGGTGTAAGGGIAANGTAVIILTDVMVTSNSAHRGGGIALLNVGSVSATRGAVSNNSADCIGGGAVCDGWKQLVLAAAGWDVRDNSIGGDGARDADLVCLNPSSTIVTGDARLGALCSAVRQIYVLPHAAYSCCGSRDHPCGTIEQAVAASGQSASVLLMPGVHLLAGTIHVELHGSLMLAAGGGAGPQRAVVMASYGWQDPAAPLISVVTGLLAIAGIVLSGARGGGRLIDCIGGTVEVATSTLADVAAGGGEDGGVLRAQRCDVRVADTTLINSTGGRSGGGRTSTAADCRLYASTLPACVQCKVVCWSPLVGLPWTLLHLWCSTRRRCDNGVRLRWTAAPRCALWAPSWMERALVWVVDSRSCPAMQLCSPRTAALPGPAPRTAAASL